MDDYENKIKAFLIFSDTTAINGLSDVAIACLSRVGALEIVIV